MLTRDIIRSRSPRPAASASFPPLLSKGLQSLGLLVPRAPVPPLGNCISCFRDLHSTARKQHPRALGVKADASRQSSRANMLTSSTAGRGSEVGEMLEDQFLNPSVCVHVHVPATRHTTQVSHQSCTVKRARAH
eukprot:scaffold129504_cov22-Tisochrysis_lutea.AAC.1